MRKIIYLSILLLFLGCRQDMKNDSSLQLLSLSVEGASVLEAGKYSYTLPETNLHSIRINMTFPSFAKLKLSSLNNIKEDENNYLVFLEEGENEILIKLEQIANPTEYKEYQLYIHKGTYNSFESSLLSALCIDEVNILYSMVNSETTINTSKNKLKLNIIPLNKNASIRCFSDEIELSDIGEKTYQITLNSDRNLIKVFVKSEKYKEKLYKIHLLKRKEAVALKSFLIESEEIYDSNLDVLTKDRFEFPNAQKTISIKLEAEKNTSLELKRNENIINGTNGSYILQLEEGENRVELICTNAKNIKIYTLFLLRSHSNFSKQEVLNILKIDERSVLHLFSGDNTITLPPVEHEKENLKIEAVSLNSDIHLTHNTNDIHGSANIYNILLENGLNKISIELVKNNGIVNIYSIYITRYPPIQLPAPIEDGEIRVEISVQDGVNGSYVDGTYINVYKTNDENIFARALIRNGKTQLNLKYGFFYDFKLEGRTFPYSLPYYAASDVLSFFVEKETSKISIVQMPINQLDKKDIAPKITLFKIGNEKIEKGNKTFYSKLEDISFEITSAYIIEKIPHGNPLPMMALGYVPSSKDKNNIKVEEISNKKEGMNYISTYVAKFNKNDIKGEFDIVIVAYDVAYNRLEYHSRFIQSNNEVKEDAGLKIENFSLNLETYPTPSTIFSIGENPITKDSTHYIPKLNFKVVKSGIEKECFGFDLFRKTEDNDFVLVKKERYQKALIPKGGYTIVDTDGNIEVGKEYSYKVIAFTKTNTKSVLSSCPSITFKLTSPTVILLTHPHNNAIINKEDMGNMSFKFSNPEVLKDATDIKLGLIISSRDGKVMYASKFKYVFNQDGSKSLYFAKTDDIKTKGVNFVYSHTEYSREYKHYTSHKLDSLIKIDKETGNVTLTKLFMQLGANLTGNSLNYEKGFTYYWDIVDWGDFVDFENAYDDVPCSITKNLNNSSSIVYYVNDAKNGGNAWNGRASFTINYK